MTVERFYNPPPLQRDGMSDTEFLEELVDWIHTTEIHGNVDTKGMTRIEKTDIPRLLEIGRTHGHTIDDISAAIKLTDGIISHIPHELQTMRARREMAERAEQQKKRKKLRN